jgi:hypothetical protein
MVAAMNFDNLVAVLGGRGAGLFSVILFPIISLQLLRKSRPTFDQMAGELKA